MILRCPNCNHDLVGTVRLEKKEATNLENRVLDPTGILSPREVQVLALIGSGLTTREAAKRIGLSHKTVDTYRTRVMDKMHFSSSAQAIHYVISRSNGAYRDGV